MKIIQSILICSCLAIILVFLSSCKKKNQIEKIFDKTELKQSEEIKTWLDESIKQHYINGIDNTIFTQDFSNCMNAVMPYIGASNDELEYTAKQIRKKWGGKYLIDSLAFLHPEGSDCSQKYLKVSSSFLGKIQNKYIYNVCLLCKKDTLDIFKIDVIKENSENKIDQIISIKAKNSFEEAEKMDQNTVEEQNSNIEEDNPNIENSSEKQSNYSSEIPECNDPAVIQTVKKIIIHQKINGSDIEKIFTIRKDETTGTCDCGANLAGSYWRKYGNSQRYLVKEPKIRYTIYRDYDGRYNIELTYIELQ